jgi:hypothetical protein
VIFAVALRIICDLPALIRQLGGSYKPIFMFEGARIGNFVLIAIRIQHVRQKINFGFL